MLDEINQKEKGSTKLSHHICNLRQEKENIKQNLDWCGILS